MHGCTIHFVPVSQGTVNLIPSNCSSSIAPVARPLISFHVSITSKPAPYYILVLAVNR